MTYDALIVADMFMNLKNHTKISYINNFMFCSRFTGVHLDIYNYVRNTSLKKFLIKIYFIKIFIEYLLFHSTITNSSLINY